MSTADAALARLAAAMGIEHAYRDFDGVERVTGVETQRALLAALGIDAANPGAVSDAADAIARPRTLIPDETVAETGKTIPVSLPHGATWSLVDAETGDLAAEGRTSEGTPPAAPPAGVYDLIVSHNGQTETGLLIAAPADAPSVFERTGTERIWGLTTALYGLRSASNHGIGDFRDLTALGRLAAEAGAAFVGINPVHALGVAARAVISPYSPSHRGMLNTLHLPIGGGGTDDGDFLDYAATRARAEAKLAHDWHRNTDPISADPVSADVADFALYEAISEGHGPDWRTWPPALRDRDTVALERERASRADRIRYHAWLQGQAASALATAQQSIVAAGAPLGLYLDLAVGARRGGAEAWCNAATIAQGVSVGAPPDHLAPGGQNWQLAGYAPNRLRAERYAPWRSLLRANMRHAGALRIDHVLGLARSFWIPDDDCPGAYIRQPLDALSALCRIEAVASGTVIVGEDLGLVPEGFRETMRGHGFHGYSVLQYERDGEGFRDPSAADPRILACFATHDTPTLSGYVCGRDIDWWHRLGWIDAAKAEDLRADRASAVDALRQMSQDARTDSASFTTAIHDMLAASPAALVSIQLDDMMQDTEAQNVPGTIDEHPNWRRRARFALDDPRLADAIRDTGQQMRAAGRDACAPSE